MLRVNEYFDHVYVLNLGRLRDRYERLRPRLEELGIEHERFEGVDGLEVMPEPKVISGNLFSEREFDSSEKGERQYLHCHGGNVTASEAGLYLLSVSLRHEGPQDVAVRYYLNKGDQTLRYGTAKPIATGDWQRVSWELYKQPDEHFDSINFLLMGGQADRTRISDPELLQTDYRSSLSRGMIGCNLSHARIARDAGARGYVRMLVLEDDLYFHRDFHARFADVIPHIPSDWQLLYLGCKQRARRWKDIEIHEPGWYRAVECNGTLAYALSRPLYEVFAETVEQNEKPVDLAMHKLQHDYPAYVIFPNLVIANESESSTQEKSPEDARRIAEASRWDLSLYA
jgi:GR25 family glycosyltransferase involved in LPS biosynthesis